MSHGTVHHHNFSYVNFSLYSTITLVEFQRNQDFHFIHPSLRIDVREIYFYYLIFALRGTGKNQLINGTTQLLYIDHSREGNIVAYKKPLPFLTLRNIYDI